MMFQTLAIVAAAITPALAIPPPDFGFPEAPNDTALTIRFQDSNQDIFVQEAALYGINVTATAPLLAVNTTSYQSLQDYDGNYTVIMVDPDASYPENPTNRFILHWMQPNMTQSNNTLEEESMLSTGRTLENATAPLVEYRRPSPATNSSAHRYIIYAFQQQMNFSIPQQWMGLSNSNRSRFNLTNFISDTGLGEPAAANYFYVSNQTNVPGNFTASPGGQYPGGDGTAVTSGNPYRPTSSGSAGVGSGGASGGGSGSSSGSSTSSAGAAMITGVGSLVGAGIVGLAALM